MALAFAPATQLKPDTLGRRRGTSWFVDRGVGAIASPHFGPIPFDSKANVDRVPDFQVGETVLVELAGDAPKFRVPLVRPTHRRQPNGTHWTPFDERVLATAPESLRRRQVRLERLGRLTAPDFPIFAKPVVPKQFRAAVYSSLAELETECRGLDADADVMISEIVSLRAEARAFVLDSVVRTVSVYDGHANSDHAAYFADA